MNEYYSYTIESLEDSGSLCTFYSPINKRLYSVSFDAFLYQEYLSTYPLLLKNGWALSFYEVKTDTGHKLKFDQVVGFTIVQTLSDYLHKQGDECVLIYHCDTDDDKQKARHVLFERWYRKANMQGSLIKEGVEVIVPTEEGGERVYYLGYITHKNNPNIESIKREFDAFSYFLPSFLKNPGA